MRPGARLRRAGGGLVAPLVLMAAACHRTVAPATSSGGAAASTQPALPRIPRDAPRFEIDSVTDSTATFRVQEARWIKPGLQSYVVDPQQRDALVARLRIVRTDSVSATALITSQVGRVKTDHFVLVLQPRRRPWQTRAFWWGAGFGAVIGASLVALF